MDAAVKPIAEPTAVTEFVARWKGNTGSERANFQSFIRELCELLAVCRVFDNVVRYSLPAATTGTSP